MTAPLALSFAAARERALAGLEPLPAVRRPLAECAGRALREDVAAPHALPPFRNSAMDGWAVRSGDLAAAREGAGITLPVVAEIAAGRPAERDLGPGEAMRIMTGAPVPEGADAVLPFESGSRGRDGAGAETLRTGTAIARGENVREAGADVAAGETVLAAGRELGPHDVALAAALGAAALAVGPSPRVTVLSTGDELLAPGEPLRPGAIRDSNLGMLAQLCAEAGAGIVAAERIRDDADAVARRVRAALESSDVVLTIGGVSEGDFDPVKQALAALGGIEAWRVAMRPGRPQAWGRPSGRLFAGLPGNPASVACVFETLVRPALRCLQGYSVTDRPRVPVIVAEAVPSRAGRTDFVRCTLAWRDGRLHATPAGAQVSGHLAPQSRAHALLVVPEPAAELPSGAAAEALLLRLPAAPDA
jgi:molybdopterin molybdotransferase